MTGEPDALTAHPMKLKYPVNLEETILIRFPGGRPLKREGVRHAPCAYPPLSDFPGQVNLDNRIFHASLDIQIEPADRLTYKWFDD
ncbi:MAG: hypothetical protein ACE14T_05770 [Syntrophales bacterium]